VEPCIHSLSPALLKTFFSQHDGPLSRAIPLGMGPFGGLVEFFDPFFFFFFWLGGGRSFVPSLFCQNPWPSWYFLFSAFSLPFFAYSFLPTYCRCFFLLFSPFFFIFRPRGPSRRRPFSDTRPPSLYRRCRGGWTDFVAPSPVPLSPFVCADIFLAGNPRREPAA